MNKQFLLLPPNKIKIGDFIVVGTSGRSFYLECPDPLCIWAEHDTIRSIDDLIKLAREHKKAHQRKGQNRNE